MRNLPASSESPLSGAIMAKAEDGDDGRGLRGGQGLLSYRAWSLARHPKAEDVDCFPYLAANMIQRTRFFLDEFFFTALFLPPLAKVDS